MIVIGITGGIGCGKSLVCGYLEEKYDALLLTADTIAHEVIRPGGLAYSAYLELFGPDYLLQDGTFDRKKIGDLAFKDPRILDKMNGIVHPAVRAEILSRIAEAQKAGKEIAVVEAALLIEADYHDFCREYWYVYADKDTRIKRLLASRDLTVDKIASIMERQLDEDAFRMECDFVIDNSGDFSDTAAAVDKRISWLKNSGER